jgi:hypothetical protein
MNPETQRLSLSPRELGEHAFFADDRSTTVEKTKAINQFEIAPRVTKGPKAELIYETEVLKGHKDLPGGPSPAIFTVYRNRHVVDIIDDEENPLPHARMTALKEDGGVIDRLIAGWKHKTSYICFFSYAARALSATAAAQPRLQVKLLFGTGSEYYRHGVCGAVETAARPTLLIVVHGVEPTYPIRFFNPSNPAQMQELEANNRWGVGITTAVIEKAISRRYGSEWHRAISYDISVCAAFSTGYAGLQGSIIPPKGGTLFPTDRLERVVIFDCLYASLKPALDRVKAARPNVRIIVYVVTERANSFKKTDPTFDDLALGGNPAWNYINLMGNVQFHAVTSARLVNEARRPDARILDPLPAGYEATLTSLVGRLPPRNSMVSNDIVSRKVKGPSRGGTVLASFAADKTNAAAISKFFQNVTATRRCIGRAQLLGWAAPPGEEWHDMLLIEFAWEYLA